MIINILIKQPISKKQKLLDLFYFKTVQKQEKI